MYDIYKSKEDAKSATNDFYGNEQGFQYDEQKATQWISDNVKLPKTGKVLDICCGDGIWSKAINNLNPALECYGVDISEAGIEAARRLLGIGDDRFIAADVEVDNPIFEPGTFDFIFVRGAGIFNQHNMDRPFTIKVIEVWHSLLKPETGRMFSTFGSNPQLMGTYTPMEKCKLPYNRSPRRTPAVQFSGGKFHHSIESFLAPYWKAEGVEIADYWFHKKRHNLITKFI